MGAVALLGLLCGRRVQSAATWHLWSDPATWNGHIPAAGADVVIPYGKRVLLDVSPPPLHCLDINGSLRFADKDLGLRVGCINARGLFAIGSESRPFTHRATLTLTGEKGSRNIQGSGPKMLSVLSGRLELHGAAHGPNWTRLSATAYAGTSKLTLERAVGWRAGDALVVASTDYDPAQAEERRITAIRGNVITLDNPLRWTHWGQIAQGVDERAEVGCLSHNIVIEGDADSDVQGLGGHIMVMKPSTAHIADVELTRMGQKGQLGRYPLHFHLAGDVKGAYVRDCSIHKCYNRFLTLHGTQNARIEGCVGYDTIGHGYFLEDGVETHNALIGNLGLMTRRARPGENILPSDLEPAVFWLTNPDNIVRGNAAAGSERYGFWMSLPLHPTGPSRTAQTDANVWPRRTPLGVFADNVTHSNEHSGLNVDNGPNPAGVYDAPNYSPHSTPAPPQRGHADSAPLPAYFDNITAYKNRRRGLWLRGQNLLVRHAHLADNSIGITLAASQSGLFDSRIVGESDNRGMPAPGERWGVGGRSLPKPAESDFPLRGFEFYDGLVSAQNVTFVNFQPNRQRRAGAISYLRFSPFFVDPRNFVSHARFDNANPVYLDSKGAPGNPKLSGDGYRSAIFVDQDGTVTGKPGQAVTVNNPFLVDAACTLRPIWNAYVGPARYGRLFIDNHDVRPCEIGPVFLTRDDRARPTYGIWGVPHSGPNISFQTMLLTNRDYTVGLHGPPPANMRLSLRFRPPGDWIQLSLSWPGPPPFLFRDRHKNEPLAPALTLAGMQAGNGNLYHLANGRLTVRLVTRGHDANGTASLDVCRTNACP